ncbi:hypothetical protein, partial [Peribacillus frigoritolerans]|uniref:hypothetical protein n=1 Tax=Peribacillus frigoritolerans TaxID=450367 RepID=UPI0020241C32
KLVKNHASKDLYDKLVAGPPRERKLREFQNGSEGDVYYAVMTALSYLTHETEITVDMVREQLNEILVFSTVPFKT